MPVTSRSGSTRTVNELSVNKYSNYNPQPTEIVPIAPLINSAIKLKEPIANARMDYTANSRMKTYYKNPLDYLKDPFYNYDGPLPSVEIRRFIKDYEGGLHLESYDPSYGKGDWTIGYGNKLTEYMGQKYNPNIKWTAEEAQKEFESDIKKMLTTTFIPFLKKNNIKLTQNQFDAMLSFTYNFGENTWGSYGYKTMKDFLIKGDYSEAATRKAFSMYMGGRAEAGHIKRRNDEIDMFLYGDYKRDENPKRPIV